MQSSTVAEVLVPKAFLWWTFLALAGDPVHRFASIRFINAPTGSADVVLIDASLISPLADAMEGVPKAVVLLWDGCQSYWTYKRSIEVLARRAQHIELRMVGDPPELAGRSGPCCPCGYLFSQQDSVYAGELLDPERLRTISFASRFGKTALRHRAKLISAKVAAQLMTTRRWEEYRRTRFVFCGQSGIYTLRAHASRLGMDPHAAAYTTSGIGCEPGFIAGWLEAVLRLGENWESRVLKRALLRLIAIRALARARPQEIFFHLYPERNLNAYQAASLFRQHVFLEFGGIQGDEAIYPRTADLVFFSRRVIRFDASAALRRLSGLCVSSHHTLSSLISWFEDQAISTFDRYSVADIREVPDPQV